MGLLEILWMRTCACGGINFEALETFNGGEEKWGGFGFSLP